MVTVIIINVGEKHSKSSITEKSDGNGNLKDHFGSCVTQK